MNVVRGTSKYIWGVEHDFRSETFEKLANSMYTFQIARSNHVLVQFILSIASHRIDNIEKFIFKREKFTCQALYKYKMECLRLKPQNREIQFNWIIDTKSEPFSISSSPFSLSIYKYILFTLGLGRCYAPALCRALTRPPRFNAFNDNPVRSENKANKENRLMKF